MQDYFNIRTYMLGAFALALAALLAGPAQAKPTPFVAQSGVEPAMVIPYLSHGIGVDKSQFAGVEAKRNSAAQPTMVVPYLSHGVGVDETQFTGNEPQVMAVPYLSHGVGVDESQFAGSQQPTFQTTATVSDDEGLAWEWKAGGLGALIAAAAALALAGRQRRDVALP
jgi:hypothetical protein